ncbi:MAG: protein-glutamate O-methyltransferase CheR [Chloroflexota bacterium]
MILKMESKVTEHQEAVLDILLEKVYRDSGHDFRDYRRGTVARRLERRMLATGVKTYIDYMYFLDSHPEEYGQFANYLTIKVSRFFRSPYTFQQMAALVIPELLLNRKRREESCLKFWSAGCARGEEPYSIAIMLADFLGESRSDYDITIFASDIGYLDLNKLRSGIYTAADVEDLPYSILDRYFIPDGDNYEVRADIRQMVQFFHFDLTSVNRQPLPGMDCIFCCNVLIYFQRQLQERVLGKFYNSLAVPGYLVLGEVETPTNGLLEKLECLDGKAKIYKKVDASGK